MHTRQIILCLLMTVVFLSVESSGPEAQGKPAYGLAVLDLQAIGISETEALSLSEVLRSGISRVLVEEKDAVKAEYKLLERSQMEKILDEFAVQSTGCTDVECAVEFGKMFSVDRIIIGSIGLVGSTYTIIARIVDVETGTILSIVNRKQRGEIDSIIDLMPLVGRELLTGERLAAPETSPVTPQAKKSETQPPASSVTTPAREQYFSVKGTPDNADVFLNEEKIGNAPIDFRRLNPGRYSVRIAQTGYEPHEEEVVIEPGKDRIFSYTLTQYASLTFSGSPEGASIYLNDTKIGTAPLNNHFVPQGKYTVKATSDRHLDFLETITVLPGQKRTVFFKLPALVSISVNGSPTGAMVRMNGKDIGQAPVKNHTVTEGEYRVEVRKTGFERFSKKVSVGTDSPVEVSYSLKPIDIGKIFKKSLVLPGSGQWYSGKRGKGALITVLQLATIGGAAVTSLNAMKAQSDYDDAYDAYRNAVTISAIDAARSDMNDTYNTAKSADTMQIAAIGAVAVVYLYNVIDAVVTSRTTGAGRLSSRIDIEPGIGKGSTGVVVSWRF